MPKQFHYIPPHSQLPHYSPHVHYSAEREHVRKLKAHLLWPLLPIHPPSGKKAVYDIGSWINYCKSRPDAEDWTHIRDGGELKIRYTNILREINKYNRMVGETDQEKLRQQRQEVMLYIHFWGKYCEIPQPEMITVKGIKTGHEKEDMWDRDLLYYIKGPNGEEDMMTPEACMVFLKRHGG